MAHLFCSHDQSDLENKVNVCSVLLCVLLNKPGTLSYITFIAASMMYTFRHKGEMKWDFFFLFLYFNE